MYVTGTRSRKRIVETVRNAMIYHALFRRGFDPFTQSRIYESVSMISLYTQRYLQTAGETIPSFRGVMFRLRYSYVGSVMRVWPPVWRTIVILENLRLKRNFRSAERRVFLSGRKSEDFSMNTNRRGDLGDVDA